MNVLVWGMHHQITFPPVVRYAAMGVFDGVHLGHRVLLDQTLSDAQNNDAEPWVITFDRNPARALSPGTYFGDVQTLEMKLDIFQSMGFAGALILPFDENFRQQEAGVFLNTLLDWFPLHTLRVGENFHMGRYPGITAAEIEGVCRARGRNLRVDITPIANHNREPISSTWIRRSILDGDLRTAELLLGRHFSLDLRGIPNLRHGNLQGIWKQWSTQVMPEKGSFSMKTKTGTLDCFGVVHFSPQSVFWEGQNNNESLEILILQPLVTS